MLLPCCSCRQGSVIYPPARGNLTFIASDLQESGCEHVWVMQLDVNNKAPKGHWACIVYACLVSLPKMYMCEWQPIRKYQTKRILWLSFLLSSLINVSITYKIIMYSKTSLSKMLSVLSSIILLQHIPSHPLCQTLLAPSSLEVLRVEIASEIIVTTEINILKPLRIDRKFPEFQDLKEVKESMKYYEKSIEFRYSECFICFMIAWFSSICNSRNFLPLASTPNHYGLEVSGQSLGEHASRVAVKGPGPTSLLRAHASVSNKMIFEK